MSLEYVVWPVRELDGHYLQYHVWTQELDEDTLAEAVICQAFDASDFEIGKLAIDATGAILIVEVEAEHRRKGIATRMLSS